MDCSWDKVLKIKSKELVIGDSSIKQENAVRSIGACLDREMKMNSQVSAVCKSAWYHLYQIGKIRKYLTEEQTKSLVHAHVTSRIDQNNSLLLGLQQYKLKKIQLVQNAAARLIKGLRKRDHITPALREMHWLPVEQRILYKVLLMVFKALHGQGPQYISELVNVYVPTRTLRISNECVLAVPECHYKDTRMRAFGIRAPTEWNQLPIGIRRKETVESFKSALKTYLFRQAYQ